MRNAPQAAAASAQATRASPEPVAPVMTTLRPAELAIHVPPDVRDAGLRAWEPSSGGRARWPSRRPTRRRRAACKCQAVFPFHGKHFYLRFGKMIYPSCGRHFFLSMVSSFALPAVSSFPWDGKRFCLLHGVELWVPQPVGLSPQREASRVMQDPVEHGRDQGLVAHEPLPPGDLPVGGEHHGHPPEGVRHEAEEAVCPLLGDWRVADLVDDDELAFPEVAQAEARLAVDVGLVRRLDERPHPLEGHGAAVVDGGQPQPRRDRRLAQAGRTGEHDVAVRAGPVELLGPPDPRCRDAALRLGGVELAYGPHAGREVRRGAVAPAREAPLRLGRRHSPEGLPAGQLVAVGEPRQVRQRPGRVLHASTTPSPGPSPAAVAPPPPTRAHARRGATRPRTGAAPVVADAVDGRRGRPVVAEGGPPSAGPRVGGRLGRPPPRGTPGRPGRAPRGASPGAPADSWARTTVFDSLRVGDLSTRSFGFRHENIAEMSMGMPTTPRGGQSYVARLQTAPYGRSE